MIQMNRVTHAAGQKAVPVTCPMRKPARIAMVTPGQHHTHRDLGLTHVSQAAEET